MVIFQLPILSIVLLLIEPNRNRPFQRYHAVTSTAFWFVAVLYEIVLGLATVMLTAGHVGHRCRVPDLLVSDHLPAAHRGAGLRVLRAHRQDAGDPGHQQAGAGAEVDLRRTKATTTDDRRQRTS